MEGRREGGEEVGHTSRPIAYSPTGFAWHNHIIIIISRGYSRGGVRVYFSPFNPANKFNLSISLRQFRLQYGLIK